MNEWWCTTIVVAFLVCMVAVAALELAKWRTRLTLERERRAARDESRAAWSERINASGGTSAEPPRSKP